MSNKVWQIAELEEEKKGFVDFPVSMVAEHWIQEKDDKLFCLWPDTFAPSKIISAAHPKPGEKWTLYPCRLLMNGAKYTVYEEALEAEKICMNVSTMSEFERKTKKIKASNEHYQPLKLKESDDGDTETESSSEDNCIIGNDSFDFNKQMLFNCWWDEDATSVEESCPNIDVEKLNSSNRKRVESTILHEDDKLKEKEYIGFQSDDKLKEKEYIGFQSNITSMLTSTAISEHDEPKTMTKSRSNLLERIGNLQLILVTFTREVQCELDALKSAVLDIDNTTSDDELSMSSINEVSHAATMSPSGSRHDNLNQFDDVCFETSEQLETNTTTTPTNFENHTIPMASDEVGSVENVDNFPLMYMDSTFKIPERELVSVERLQNLTVILEKGDPVVPSVDMSTATTLPTGRENLVSKPTANSTFVCTSSQDLAQQNDPENESLILPISSVSHYQQVEQLLFVPAFEKAFKEITLPKDKETAAKYMDRIFRVIFDEEFLLNCVSFRKEKNRVDVKGSNILFLWQDSCATKFGLMETPVIMAHCRRLKSAMRASKSKGSKIVAAG